MERLLSGGARRRVRVVAPRCRLHTEAMAADAHNKPATRCSGEVHVRTFVLALPGVEEQPHHGFPSFRVQGRIFATLPDPEHLRIFLTDEAALEASQNNPGWCFENRWGSKLSGVAITLDTAPRRPVEEYLLDAWSQWASDSELGQIDAHAMDVNRLPGRNPG